MDDVNSKDWCEKPRVTGTMGNGWCVRIDGTDVFDSINQYGCKTRRSLDIVKGLGSKEEADAYLAQWLRDQLPDFDAQRLRADTAEAERDALRTSKEAVEFNLNKVDRALLAAEQRIAELEADLLARNALLEELGCPFEPVEDLYVKINPPGIMAGLALDAYRRAISAKADAALNPKPEAGSHE